MLCINIEIFSEKYMPGNGGRLLMYSKKAEFLLWKIRLMNLLAIIIRFQPLHPEQYHA